MGSTSQSPGIQRRKRLTLQLHHTLLRLPPETAGIVRKEKERISGSDLLSGCMGAARGRKRYVNIIRRKQSRTGKNRSRRADPGRDAQKLKSKTKFLEWRLERLPQRKFMEKQRRTEMTRNLRDKTGGMDTDRGREQKERNGKMRLQTTIKYRGLR